jgi:hypothetical protein
MSIYEIRQACQICRIRLNRQRTNSSLQQVRGHGGEQFFRFGALDRAQGFFDIYTASSVFAHVNAQIGRHPSGFQA